MRFVEDFNKITVETMHPNFGYKVIEPFYI